MKKKLDFVTNSSSTSFCGWGIFLSRDKLIENEEILKLTNYKKEEILKDHWYDFIDDLSEALGKENIYVCAIEREGAYIALSYEDMRETQTLKEFKSILWNKLEELKIKETAKYIEDVIYN